MLYGPLLPGSVKHLRARLATRAYKIYLNQKPPVPMDDRDAAERILEPPVLAFLLLSERRQRVRLLAVRKVPRRRLAGRLPPRLLLQHHEADGAGQVLLRGPHLRGMVSHFSSAGGNPS